jgi:hypothetical protein
MALISRKGEGGLLAIIVIVVVVLIVIAIAITMSKTTPPSPAQLDFSVDFPKAISPGQSVSIYVSVTNNGMDAKDVSVVVVSDAVSAITEQKDVGKNATVAITVSLLGKDIQDGSYSLRARLKYSDQLGSHETADKEYSIHLLPSAELTDVKFQQELMHPFGKDTIGKTDSTTVLFKIHSKSSTVIYSGMTAKATLSINVAGVTIDPASILIEPIGPNGKTADYSFKISSNNTPPGTYDLSIYLFSKDNQLIQQQTLHLTVTG